MEIKGLQEEVVMAVATTAVNMGAVEAVERLVWGASSHLVVLAKAVGQGRLLEVEQGAVEGSRAAVLMVAKVGVEGT